MTNTATHASYLTKYVLCSHLLGLRSKGPQTRPHTPEPHSRPGVGVVGRAAPSAAVGGLPRRPEVSGASWLWQHRSSLPTASPGVSPVSGCPFHEDAGQGMRAALPQEGLSRFHLHSLCFQTRPPLRFWGEGPRVGFGRDRVKPHGTQGP